MILTVEQREALIRYLRVRAEELDYDLGTLQLSLSPLTEISFTNFTWTTPDTERWEVVDLRHLVDIALQARILQERPVISATTAITPREGFTHQPIIETDVIGGFPIIDPLCLGCRRPLTIDNAWMSDGCECNSPLGVNSMNETRWRLLMQLQQRQNFQLAELRSIVQVQVGEFTITEYPNGTRTIGGNIQAAPNHVILELPLP